MESKPTASYAVISLFVFIFFFISSTMAQNTVIPVRVGVVLDKEHYVGEMGLKCISMALSDFYATHGYYKTRLVLNYRDSKKDIVGAAAAALDLVKNVEVQAMIGPLTSGQANFVINLGDKARVPIITFSATSPSLSSIRSPYFIQAALCDSSQVQAIAAIIQAFGWREVVPIYVDNAFGEGIMPFLTDALGKVNVRIPYRSVIPPSPTDDQIVAELYKLMTMQTRVFVVHLVTRLGNRLFTKAKQLGMMSKDYAWIITDGMANELTSIDPSVMRGVVGIRPHVPNTKKLDNFTTRYKRWIQHKKPTAGLNTYGLWAYDSAIALALAAEKAGVRNATYLRPNISGNSTDLEGFGVSSVGTELIRALLHTRFDGLAGKFELVNGQLQPPPYEIVNVVGPKAQVVGYWMKETGIVRELNFTNGNEKNHSSSMSNIRSIIWPGKKRYPPKGWVIPTSGKKLRIGVPVKQGFFEFMNVTWNSDNSHVEGYCRDVFDVVMDAMPYGVQYEYVPFATSDHKSGGSYDDLIRQVFLGKYYAAVGDLTIIANRSQYVDFTLPYTESGVSMVVPIKRDESKNAWVFLKPLTWKLWVTSFCSFVFMGLLIWILEHRINEDFRGPLSHQVGMIFWFAFSTMVFANKERVISNLSRFVLIIWFFVVLILTQSYTASLASMLTVQQLQPTITDIGILVKNNDSVGYQKGTFVFGLLKSKGFQDSRLLEYNTIDEMDELLSKGTAKGGIAAAFDEIPYMKLFLAKYCSKYIMVGPTYKTDGFGFVFPKGSPLVPDISRAVLKVTEGEKMRQIEKKWLGDDSKCQDSGDLITSNNINSKSLGLESFLGLFLIVGVAALSAFLIYVIGFLHQNWHVMDSSHPESTVQSKMLELFRRFNNKDLSCHMFNNKDQNDSNCESGCLKIEIESCNEHFQSTSPIFSPPTPSPVFSTADEGNQQDTVLEDQMTNQESPPTKQEISTSGT